ncbi:ArsR family transcriptional regulator [Corynebacterium diphtheriae]|uniref:ArsR family transcriptional regulator n=1 Tax=Corynebacterium diphtheriae TaxID=1717 RepID=UPI000F10C554|nr:ArsR family transcriptional regulator [Corynebacterium diphtheriae]MBG9317409.1 helix-turn-helix transcriptional regulator [Corynebacterium diphtheriae bv. mitis]QOE68896.1 helix-turn-helix transcriptional regulator [Corynebacterium diphtheriae bv. mitis]RKW82393.1 transcriptional regulator [Corynebacterium diphtheriae]RKW98057.1 transcriptional regulator [Corynebacterium diphtheriae]RKX05188.1 transcriptional regulator [Corynebacterium diphtheriae]
MGTSISGPTTPEPLQQPTVSHHLRVLVDTGLLQREKRGNWVHYSLMPGSWEIVRAAQAVQTTQAT